MTNTARRSITPVMAATFAVLFASVAGEVAGASQGTSGLVVFAGGAFAGAILRLAWQLNAPWWQPAHASDIGPSRSDAQPIMAARNARLIALGYAWGAASLLAIYLLSPLRWQHGWQYGTGMGLIALLIFMYSRALEGRWTTDLNWSLTWVALIHSWAATAGLGWMIGVGKFYSAKGDWAANIVFACGGLMIVGVTIMALRTGRFLSQSMTT